MELATGRGIRSDYYTLDLAGAAPFHFTGAQANAIAFWRDPAIGVFGIETGLFSEVQLSGQLHKLGGVAGFHMSDTFVLSGFGGALLPIYEDFTKLSHYGGGHLTWYLSATLALTTDTEYQHIRYDTASYSSLRAGGSVRYLSTVEGLEFTLSSYYRRCAYRDGIADATANGVKGMASMRIQLGGTPGSLMSHDRSGAIDTRTWTCEISNSL